MPLPLTPGPPRDRDGAARRTRGDAWRRRASVTPLPVAASYTRCRTDIHGHCGMTTKLGICTCLLFMPHVERRKFLGLRGSAVRRWPVLPLPFGVRAAQPQQHERAALWPGRGGQLAALGPGEPPTDVEAQPDPAEPAPVAGLTLHEPLEDPLVVTGRDADSLVGHRDLDLAGRHVRPHGDRAAVRRG